MHQTFYIDIDEEITSIVERLRKAKAKEVVIVVPKRALLIQSIVNLKLLKKEAENLKKEIILVTQDKLGKMLIEKTGILVEQKLDDIEGEELSVQSEKPKIKLDAEEVRQIELKNKLDDIGSSEYYNAEKYEEEESVLIVPEEKNEDKTEENERITNKELVSDIGEELKSKKSIFGKKNAKKVSGSMDMIKNIDIRQGGKAMDTEKSVREIAAEGEKEDKAVPIKTKVKRSFVQDADLTEKKPARYADRENTSVKKIEKLFLKEETSRMPAVGKNKEKKEYAEVDVPGGFQKFLWIFGTIGVVAALLVTLYLFVPKADIVIYAQGKTQSVDAEIKGDSQASSVDLANKVVPTKIVSENVDLSETFDSTGSGAASDQRAQGMITIYNDYDSESQPLVATTRFETSDGKIFRLMKSVVVPGTTKANGTVQPGTIDAQVVADAAGTAYNVGPTTFSIPGFKDSGDGKYAKIYAKSTQAMVGGESSGSGAVKIVSDNDVTSGESKLASDLVNAAKQKIKNDSGSDTVVLDDAIDMGTPSYTPSVSAGTAADKFSISASVKATAIVFSQKDVVSIVENMIKQNNPDDLQISDKNISLEFGKSDANFTDGTLTISAHGTAIMLPNINLDNLKKEILGKSESQLEAYLKSYSDISQAEVSYWPTFISGRIPALASRVNISLDNN